MTICSSEMVAAHAANYPSRASEYGPYLREFLVSGSRVTAQQLSAARKRRAELTAQLVALLDSVDAMAGPAGDDPAWPITHELQVGSLPAYHAAWSAAAPRSAEFTMPMDLARVPAICLPCGFAAEGVPYSIQFTGRRLSEGCCAALLMPMNKRPAGTTYIRTCKDRGMDRALTRTKQCTYLASMQVRYQSEVDKLPTLQE
jgi:Asp-tRNA(Asn)/Glu-tRNA(Gln) amidotransferase A subunit family amidase